MGGRVSTDSSAGQQPAGLGAGRCAARGQNCRMEIADFESLLTDEGQALLAELGDYSESAALALASKLRGRYPAALAAAALTQARLRGRAKVKFGADADRM